MRLRIITPTSIVLDEDMDKVTAEGLAGSFTIEPRHIDYAVPLVPSILSLSRKGTERFFAVDTGMLVKKQDTLSVAVRRAVEGQLGRLESEVRRMLEEKREKEREANTAVAKLEAGFARRILGMGHVV